MIPKVIHYCWFGRNPLPDSAVKCINSWRKFMPDYEIKEWNEDNFDVNAIPYTAEAYQMKKYAFVSDYARFWILYRYGGVYFDTDVELIKPIDDIVEKGPFMGIEETCKIIPVNLVGYPLVNPGLGIAVEQGHPFYKQLIDYYNAIHFVDQNGYFNPMDTVVMHTTNLMVENGLQKTDQLQQVCGIWIYPDDFFNPLDDLTGRLKKTANTRSIHWYARTWQDRHPFKQWLSCMSHRIFGLQLYKLKRKLRGID